MKKIYKATSLVFAVILTGYLFIHVSYMYRGYNRLMGFYGLDNNTIDVAFVGTSITFSSFMPMEAWDQYGMAAYNYCTNVQYENSLRYSIREINKTQSPKLIMVDISPFFDGHYAVGMDDLSVKYNLDSMKYSWDRVKLTAEINRQVDGNLYSFLYYYFDIAHYHTNTPSIEQYNNALNDYNRGYGFLAKQGGQIINLSETVADDGSIVPLKGIHEEFFRDLIAETDKLDCDIVYYCAPVFFCNKEQFGRKNYIKNEVKKAGYTFWDFSGDIETVGLDPAMDYWSRDHFDSLGAEKVTSYIAEKIKENYDIPDRRDDPRYEQWDDDYEEWLILKSGYREEDIGLGNSENLEQFIEALNTFHYDAVIEVFNPEALRSVSENTLKKIGLSVDRITADTDFLIVKKGGETTVLDNAHTSGTANDTVLGTLNVFYNESGEYGVYLNGEECMLPSKEVNENIDFRIKSFLHNDPEQVLFYAAVTLNMEESKLKIQDMDYINMT